MVRRNYTAERWGMPNYYTRDTNDCDISIRPKGFREFGLLRKWPLRGGWHSRGIRQAPFRGVALLCEPGEPLPI
ncbi:hypothetical protein ACFLWD_00795 [Chloroflexota bacterium]